MMRERHRLISVHWMNFKNVTMIINLIYCYDYSVNVANRPNYCDLFSVSCSRPTYLISCINVWSGMVIHELSCISLCMDICFLLGKYLGAKLLRGKYILNFLRNCQTIFQGGCTILHSHQQWLVGIWLIHESCLTFPKQVIETWYDGAYKLILYYLTHWELVVRIKWTNAQKAFSTE